MGGLSIQKEKVLLYKTTFHRIKVLNGEFGFFKKGELRDVLLVLFLGSFFKKMKLEGINRTSHPISYFIDIPKNRGNIIMGLTKQLLSLMY